MSVQNESNTEKNQIKKTQMLFKNSENSNGSPRTKNSKSSKQYWGQKKNQQFNDDKNDKVKIQPKIENNTIKVKMDDSVQTIVKKSNSAIVRNNVKSVSKVAKKPSIKIIPLGGLDEIGKNMTLIEYENDIVIIDCGLAFPDHEMLGVDIVIPDFSYVEENKNKVRGIVITHGHEDHIGGIAYLIRAIGSIPIYGTKLTLGLLDGKLKEHRLSEDKMLHIVQPRDVIKLGCMSVEFIAVNHSIPDACALAITTPMGVIVHTGDFKVDYTPINSQVIDLARFSELGSEGVLALLSDSTNAERSGTTISEKKVGESFEILFKKAKNKRMIVATFASNIHRIQQIMNAAISSGRKIAVSGRSMETVVAKAIELEYLNVPKNVIINIDTINNYSNEQLIIITTGSQGEPMSALRRMSMGDHRKVSITSNDFIIISANPIPGNEKFVNRVINDLMKLGAEVIYEAMYDVHVSGHACQDEQKLIISLTKPKYFLPVHGEYKHLKQHADIAINMGIDPKNVHIGHIGQEIQISDSEMRVTGTVPSGNIMVDGLGVGDVGNIVLRDRKRLAEDGLIIVVALIDRNTGDIVIGPDIVSRGFVYVRESEEIVNKIQCIAKDVLERCFQNDIREWNSIRFKIKDTISEFLYSKIKRKPMVITILQEISL